MATRKPISHKQRFRILERDDFTCRYCGAEAPEVKLQIDHVEPVSVGGGSDDSNLVTSCYECNSGKRAQVLSDDPPSKSKIELFRRAFDHYANLIPRDVRMEQTVISAAASALQSQWAGNQYCEWVEFFEGLERAIEAAVRHEEELEACAHPNVKA